MTGARPPVRKRVIGIDFSGARDAGKRIWLAHGERVDDRLRITHLHRAADLPESAPSRERCFPALVRFLGEQRNALIGLDFPFSLPADMIADHDWHTFLSVFPRRYPDADAFRAACLAAADGRERRRRTDIETRTPWCPYNLRLYKQTYHGIRDVLAPLVTTARAAVASMQALPPGRVWLAEICPAVTLRHLGLRLPYKGTRATQFDARRRILQGLVDRRLLQPPPADPATIILENRGGDALDSVIAAVAAARLLRKGVPDGPEDELEALEGRVFY